MSTINNRPRYAAFSVKDQEGKKPRYTRIGSAFAIKDGKGLSIQLDALPIGDRILLFEPKSSQAEEAPVETK